MMAGAAFAVGGLAASLLGGGPAGAAPTAAKSVEISTVKNANLGTLLVSDGRTLYTLKSSSMPCTATCLKFWPAVVLPTGATKARAGNGVSASKLGTIETASGAHQVTYNGKALYKFVLDKSAGQVKGNNLTDAWGTWFDVVTKKATVSHSSGATTPTTSPSGGGTAF